MSLSLCTTGNSNTGGLSCDPSRGILKKLLVYNGEFVPADYVDEATLFNALVTNSLLSKSNADKVFVFEEAQDIADTSDSNKEGSLGLGFKTVLIEGKPSYTVKMFASGDQLKRFRAMNNKTIRVLEYDANSILWGTKSGTSFKGFSAKLFFTGNRLATGQNVEEGVVVMTISVLSTSEYLDNSFYADLTGHNVEDIKGLLDAQLRVISHASNVYKVAVEIPGSKLSGPFNVFDDYGALLAALTFTAGTGANFGTPLTLTSIATDAALKCLTVTADSTMYAALASGTKIQLSGPVPSVLDAADVTKLEILPVVFTKP